ASPPQPADHPESHRPAAVFVIDPAAPGLLVRTAGEGDLPQLARLSRLAWEELEHQRGGPQYLRELVRTPSDLLVDRAADVAVVCTIGSTVVGTLTASPIIVGTGEAVGRVDAFYVEPAFRCVGAGAAMLAHLLGHARSNGWVSIDATALPGDRATKNFFETAGLTTRRLIVSVDL
ncbi:MAG: GNAT family N-acetyltransferase, partial [Actinomycetes bacterium]